ncbi:MAG: purine-binding chemotaxis protein CheW [Nitrospirae bacterium]|nr:purine-binding chemotaxis protein CheW [Nitrospirota bacterium]
MQLAVFKVGGEEYSMDIMKIMEIIRPQKVTKIPRAPRFVEGVMNLRGKVVPIVDLRKRFGVDSEGGDPKKVRVIIVRLEGRVLGMVVDEVYEVIYLNSDNVEATPDTVKGTDTEYFTGVGKVGDRLIVILDVDRLLTGDELKGLVAAEELAKRDAGQSPA